MSTANVCSPKKGKSYGMIAKWDDNNSRVLLEVLDYEICRGNRPGGILSKTGWFNVLQNFMTRTGLEYNKEKLKNRLDNMRREYVKWEKLIGKETELGWDYQKRTLAAPESWWYECAKSDPDILKYKDGGPQNLDLMQKVFAGVAATGKYVYNPFTSNPDLNIDACDRLENLEDIVDFTADIDGNRQGRIEDEATQTEAIATPTATATPSSSKLRPHKCQRRCSNGRISEADKYNITVNSLTDTICDTMTVYSKAKSIDYESMSYANAIEVLQSVPGMDPVNPIFMKAVRILEDKMRRVTFISLMKLGEEAVMKWLDTFPDL